MFICIVCCLSSAAWMDFASPKTNARIAVGRPVPFPQGHIEKCERAAKQSASELDLHCFKATGTKNACELASKREQEPILQMGNIEATCTYGRLPLRGI